MRNAAVIAGFLLVWQCAAETRSVHGIVTDDKGKPLGGAVVQIENTKTLQIRSYVTKITGEFQFHSLSPDTDYELRATYDGRSSDKKTLSRFDSKAAATIDLKIPI